MAHQRALSGLSVPISLFFEPVASEPDIKNDVQSLHDTRGSHFSSTSRGVIWVRFPYTKLRELCNSTQRAISLPMCSSIGRTPPPHDLARVAQTAEHSPCKRNVECATHRSSLHNFSGSGVAWLHLRSGTEWSQVQILPP